MTEQIPKKKRFLLSYIAEHFTNIIYNIINTDEILGELSQKNMLSSQIRKGMKESLSDNINCLYFMMHC